MKKISILCVLMITCGNAIAANPGAKWNHYNTYFDRIDYSNYDITNKTDKLLTGSEVQGSYAIEQWYTLNTNNVLHFEADKYGEVQWYGFGTGWTNSAKSIGDGAVINWIDDGWQTAKAQEGWFTYDDHFSTTSNPAPPKNQDCELDDFVTKLRGKSNTRKYFQSPGNKLYSAYVGTPSDVCITYRCAPGYRMMADPTDEYTRPEDGVWCVEENKQCPFYRDDHTYYMTTGEALGHKLTFNCITSAAENNAVFKTEQGNPRGTLFLKGNNGLIEQMTSNMQNTKCTEDAPYCTVEKLNTACGELGYPLNGDGTKTKAVDGTPVLISACEQAKSVFYYDGIKYKVKTDVFNNHNCDFMCEHNGISVNVRIKERMNIENSLVKKEQETEYARCPLFFTDSYDNNDVLTCDYDEGTVDTLVKAINAHVNGIEQETRDAAIKECARTLCNKSGGVYENNTCQCGEPKEEKKKCSPDNDNTGGEHNGYYYCTSFRGNGCENGLWRLNKRVPTQADIASWESAFDDCKGKADKAYNDKVAEFNASSVATAANTDTISTLAGRLALVEDQFGLSKWRTADGKFNTARLASDLTAGVVLGTTGALVTSSVVKKKQVKDGFESLECTVGGQHVGDWGDVFHIDGK